MYIVFRDIRFQALISVSGPTLYYRSRTFLFFGPIFLVNPFNVGWYGMYVLRITIFVKSELYLSANLQK